MGQRGLGNRTDFKNRILDMWQRKWNDLHTEISLHILVPNVREKDRINMDVNCHVTQFLTGHVNLKRFGIDQDELYVVSKAREMPEHVVYDCLEVAGSQTQLKWN